MLEVRTSNVATAKSTKSSKVSHKLTSAKTVVTDGLDIAEAFR